jgi:hypothetical protein
MKKLFITFSFFVLAVSLLAIKDNPAQAGLALVQNISPTFDFLLVSDNAGRRVETPAPNRLVVTSRSGPVSLTTQVTADGVSSQVNIDRNPTLPGATVREELTLVTVASFTVKGTVTFDDAQRSMIEFESVTPGVFGDQIVFIRGIPFQSAAYVARVTKGTGQFANWTGLIVNSILTDVSQPGFENAVGSEYILFRLAPPQ